MKQPTRIFGPAQFTSTDPDAPQVLYTVPAGAIVIVREIIIQGNAYLGVNGADADTYIAQSLSSGTYEMYLVLNAGDTLQGFTAGACLATISADVETVGE